MIQPSDPHRQNPDQDSADSSDLEFTELFIQAREITTEERKKLLSQVREDWKREIESLLEHDSDDDSPPLFAQAFRDHVEQTELSRGNMTEPRDVKSATSDTRTDRLDALAKRYLERRRAGEASSIQDYAAMNPDLADEILEFFPIIAQVQDLRKNASLFAAIPSEIPERFGDYKIFREIGRGGMGVVYEAEQESLGRRVALKVLPFNVMRSALSRDRFEFEARSAACLHHTSIVPVYEVGEEEGTRYYAMQYIRGHSLDKVIRELRDLQSAKLTNGESLSIENSIEPQSIRIAYSLATGRLTRPAARAKAAPGEALPPSSRVVPQGSETGRAERGESSDGSSSSIGSSGDTKRLYRRIAHLGRSVACALEYAHQRGIIHRDIKPSNLLLDTEGEVWVTDFGLAKSDGVDLTQTGELVGTLRYMAPERFAGEGDGRADVYALGATLYELMTLQPLFNGSDRLQLIEDIRTLEPNSPRSVDRRIPLDLETIVLKAIAKEPIQRYATAQELANDLERFSRDLPILARRVSTPERSVRWARRNPSLAFSLASVFALLATVSVVFGVGQRSERRQRIELEDQFYRSQMTLAGLASESVLGHRQVEQFVAPWKSPDLDLDPRGWEWFHLDALSKQHFFEIDLGQGSTGGASEMESRRFNVTYGGLQGGHQHRRLGHGVDPASGSRY